MFGLLMLIVIYIVLGFMLAWIVGVVAKEEIQIRTGVFILVAAGIIGIAAAFGLGTVAPDVAPVALPVINFAVLMVLINLATKIGWKNSAIVAVIYAVLLLGIGMGLRSCLAAA